MPNKSVPTQYGSQVDLFFVLIVHILVARLVDLLVFSPIIQIYTRVDTCEQLLSLHLKLLCG
jgi:TctA family transporter